MRSGDASDSDRGSKSLLNRAVALLARRDHSRAELARKLARYLGEENADDIGAVLDELERNGLLSDQRFARAVTRSRSQRFGDARIRRDLHRFGVCDETSAAALKSLEQSEVARARVVQAKRFAELPASIVERAKQARFLQSRGFSLDTIMAVLRGKAEDPADD